jgi:hypothetical protein
MPYPYNPLDSTEDEPSDQVEEISRRQEVISWVVIALTHGVAALAMLYFLVKVIKYWIINGKLF